MKQSPGWARLWSLTRSREVCECVSTHTSWTSAFSGNTSHSQSSRMYCTNYEMPKFSQKLIWPQDTGMSSWTRSRVFWRRFRLVSADTDISACHSGSTVHPNTSRRSLSTAWSRLHCRWFCDPWQGHWGTWSTPESVPVAMQRERHQAEQSEAGNQGWVADLHGTPYLERRSEHRP